MPGRHTLRYHLLNRLAESHGLSRAAFALLGGRAGSRDGVRVAGAHTDLVLEGPPGAGLEGVRRALEAVGGGLRLAHGVGLPFQLARAARFSVPCLVALLPPLDSLADSAVPEAAAGQEAHVSPEAVCLRYALFYEEAARHPGIIHLAPAEDLDRNLDQVLRGLVNHFPSLGHLLDEQALAVAWQEAARQARQGPMRLDRSARAVLGESLLADPAFAPLFRRAWTAYKALDRLAREQVQGRVKGHGKG